MFKDGYLTSDYHLTLPIKAASFQEEPIAPLRAGSPPQLPGRPSLPGDNSQHSSSANASRLTSRRWASLYSQAHPTVLHFP